MNDIQFEVMTDLAVMNPQHIETNFEAVDAYLTEAMAPYTQLVVTEDSIVDAKKTIAVHELTVKAIEERNSDAVEDIITASKNAYVTGLERHAGSG